MHTYIVMVASIIFSVLNWNGCSKRNLILIPSDISHRYEFVPNIILCLIFNEKFKENTFHFWRWQNILNVISSYKKSNVADVTEKYK